MEKDVKNQLASNPSHALPTVCDSKGTWWTAAAPASSHSDIMEFGALKMPEKAFSAVLGAGLGKKLLFALRSCSQWIESIAHQCFAETHANVQMWHHVMWHPCDMHIEITLRHLFSSSQSVACCVSICPT